MNRAGLAISSLKRILLISVAVTFVSTGSGAEAIKAVVTDTVTAPDWVTGSQWHYSDGYALRVSSHSSAATVFERLDAPGQWFSREGFIRKDAVSGTATRNSIFRTLQRGQGGVLTGAGPLMFQREYLSNGALMVHTSSWTLEGRETITVPAGTFDCWILVWRSRSMRSDWTGYERWWYSPQTQNYVRMEYKYGTAAPGSRVLMRYQIGTAVPQSPAGVTRQPDASPKTIGPRQAETASRANTVPAAPAAAEKTILSKNSALAAPISAEQQQSTFAASRTVAVLTPADASAPAGEASRLARQVVGAGSPPPKKVPSKTSAVSWGSLWHVQIISLKEEDKVRATLRSTLQKHRAQLGGLPSGVSAVYLPERGTYYRAWVGAFALATNATKLCAKLKAKGVGCIRLRGPVASTDGA